MKKKVPLTDAEIEDQKRFGRALHDFLHANHISQAELVRRSKVSGGDGISASYLSQILGVAKSRKISRMARIQKGTVLIIADALEWDRVTALRAAGFSGDDDDFRENISWIGTLEGKITDPRSINLGEVLQQTITLMMTQLAHIEQHIAEKKRELEELRHQLENLQRQKHELLQGHPPP